MTDSRGNKFRAYCTAPWVEAHLYHDGQTRPCDHNQESLGDWQKDGIESVWRGEAYQEFRRKIFAGEFPNEQCRSCHLNQTTSKLGNHVRRRFFPTAEKIFSLINRRIPEIEKLADLMAAIDLPEDWSAILNSAESALMNLKPLAIANGLDKEIELLLQLTKITRDYCTGELTPKYVAPCRQVRLINKCNARCIMCAGKFNGDIINGPGMNEDFTHESLVPADHIFGFASESSEFLLYKKWREIADQLAKNGMPKLRIFTNGILMNKENLSYLIDRKVLETLHFSMNGATKETIESGQINVKYDLLTDNIRYMFAYAAEKKAEFQLTFSFIIMRRNYQEMPILLELVNKLRGNYTWMKPEVYFAFLETNNDMDNYREFLFQQHHSLVDPVELRATFEKTLLRSKELEIPVTLFESTLEKFLESGRSPPKLICKKRDVKLLIKFLENGGSPLVLHSARGNSSQIDSLLEELRQNPNDLNRIGQMLDDEIVLNSRADIALTGFAPTESSAANQWRWALGAQQTIGFQSSSEKNYFNYKFQIPCASTKITFRFAEKVIQEIFSHKNREIVQGSFCIEAPAAAQAHTLQIDCSSWNQGERRFCDDERPLAYSVLQFTLTSEA